MNGSFHPSPARGDEGPGLAWFKPGDRSAPLFAFAGAGGAVSELAPLVQRLTDARAVACLDLAGLGGWTSVEQIADRALALMLEVQPEGPYRLLGYSFGGLIAQEIARRLRTEGRQVAVLMLVEAVYDRSFWPLGVWATSQARRTIHHLGRTVAEVTRGRLVGRAGARLAGVDAAAFAANTAKSGVEAAFIAAMGRFRPRRYPGPAVFFRANREDLLGCDPAILWRRLVGELQVENIPFDLPGIVRKPEAVALLAAAVDARLAAADAAAPVALVVATRTWHASARLALELSKAGFAVRAFCAPGHVLEKVEFVDATRRFSALGEMRTLRRELEAVAPDLIVPADDSAARLLHALHARACREGPPGETVRRLVERSLGEPASFERLYARAKVAAAAEAQGVAGPRTLAVRSRTALADAAAELGLPAVLKTDCSTGGRGVAIVHTPVEAEQAFRRLTAPPPWLWSAKRLIVDREVDRLAACLQRRRPAANVQAFVFGRPANAAAALWRGEVLACVCSEVIETLYPSGPATVVRIVRDPEMRESVARMARTLGLSGFCGFDFIVDDAGRAHLIEINPRATPTVHLTDADGRSPPQALLAAVRGRPVPAGEERAGEFVALFPQELIRDPTSPHLTAGRHDVPVESETLVRLGHAQARRRNIRSQPFKLLRRGV
jgi:thioesterase domain-containing protein/glutathione synthase/RimK-type ligase-like ATP-grasp enzyme